jgi:hypothetical protein
MKQKKRKYMIIICPMLSINSQFLPPSLQDIRFSVPINTSNNDGWEIYALLYALLFYPKITSSVHG